MSASTLPLELLLQVFTHLDARSFFAAQKVCRWWHLASRETVTLTKLLGTLPVLPPVTRDTPSPSELQWLSGEAARSLMLDYSAHAEENENATESIQSAKVPISGLPISCASQAARTAVFDGSEILIFDTSTPEKNLIIQRPLEQRLGKGLWLKSCPLNSCRIALSSGGHLLAIAFKSTVQVYDLSSQSGDCVINDCVTTTHDQTITSLEFEQNDHFLRIHLSLKGNVIYLGSPPRNTTTTSKAPFTHWSNTTRGLQNTFLDSSLLLLSRQTGPSIPTAPWLSGIQALQPSSPKHNNGYLFAAQKHGGGQSSRYTVLHAAAHWDPAGGGVLRIDHHHPSGIKEVARLESFLSSLDFGTAGLVRHDLGAWEKMPSAHEACPKFALSRDARMLVLAEREKKRVWPSPVTEVFVYRLPSAKRVAGLLGMDGEGAELTALPKYTVPAIPLRLGTVRGLVQDVVVEQVGSSYRFGVVTDEAARLWRIERV